MALTYTEAGAQGKLDAVSAAIASGDRSSAYAALFDYTLIHQRLAQSAAIDGATLSLPSPDKLQEQLDRTFQVSARNSDARKRIAHGRTGYGR